MIFVCSILFGTTILKQRDVTLADRLDSILHRNMKMVMELVTHKQRLAASHGRVRPDKYYGRSG